MKFLLSILILISIIIVGCDNNSALIQKHYSVKYKAISTSKNKIRLTYTNMCGVDIKTSFIKSFETELPEKQTGHFFINFSAMNDSADGKIRLQLYLNDTICEDKENTVNVNIYGRIKNIK